MLVMALSLENPSTMSDGEVEETGFCFAVRLPENPATEHATTLESGEVTILQPAEGWLDYHKEQRNHYHGGYRILINSDFSLPVFPLFFSTSSGVVCVLWK